MTVFVSYSHDSSEHCDKVRTLSDRLRREGVDCHIDQYETSPPEGWPRWMTAQFRDAQYVLVVCTETYYRRARGTESPGIGRGVRWESSQLFQEIYDADSMNKKFIPVLFSPDDHPFVPEPLRSSTRYDLSTKQGYGELYRYLTGQPSVVKPALGPVRVLPPRSPAESIGSTRSFWNVPFRRNVFFSGRDDLLLALHEQLKPLGDSQSPVVTCITGLGGVGKTQLCAEFAYRYRADYTATIWVCADSQANIHQSVLDTATGLGVYDAATGGAEKAASSLARWLTEHSGWLVVFDNADDIGLLSPYLPLTGAGSVLVTTRASNVDRIGTRCAICLTEFSPEESLSFLLNRTRRSDVPTDARTAAREICVELGHLPLALEQAGAFIAAKTSPFEAYLASYRARRIELLERMKPSVGGYPASVATTWAINFDEVVHESSASADLLRATAFLSPVDIPLEFIVWGAEELSDTLSSALSTFHDDPVVLDDLIEPVTRYSLVRRDGDAETLSTHRMVQEVLRGGMAPAERQVWMERIVRAVDKCFLMPTEFEHWPFCERLVPHALVAVQYCENEQLQTASPGHLLNRLGCYLSDHARYSEASVLLQRALEVRRESLGTTHRFVAETLSNLGLVAQRQGDWVRAEELHREALSIVQGSDNEQEAAARNNLAVALVELGKFTEAEQAYRRCIELRILADKRETPRTALTMVNLATLRELLGDLTGAASLLREAAAIEDKCLPPGHPGRATAMSVLACVKRKLGEAREAEGLLLGCLKIRVAAYGQHHPEVAGALSNLALVFADEGRFDEAESACRDAVALLESVHDPCHPALAEVISNLGVIYLEQSRYPDAEQQFLRSIRIWENAKDFEGWHLAAAIGNCAVLYERTGRYAEAVPLAMRALAADERVFGGDHTRVLLDVLSVGRLLMYAGKLLEAREYACRAMDASRSANGDTPDVLLDSTRLLATIEEQLGHVEEATSFYRQYMALADSRLSPGRELAMAIYNFGAYLAEHGHREEGVTSLLRAADVAASSLGADSFEEGIALYGAATVFSKANEAAKAETFGVRSLAILRKHQAKHRKDVLSCVSMLATVYHSQKRFVQADASYREAFDIWVSLGKPATRPSLAALSSYGILESERKHLPHAKELLDLASELGEKVLGPADVERATLYNNYGIYYEEAGEVDNALEMHKKALGVWEMAGWPDDQRVLATFENYAVLLRDQKRFVELEALLPRAIEKCREVLGDNSRSEAIHLNDLGVAVASQGRQDEAIKYFEAALAIWETMGWPKDGGVDVVYRNLYSYALMHGAFSVAASAAEAELAYVRKHHGVRHPVLVASLNNLGVVYREWGRLDRAEDYFEQAVQMVNCTLGSNHPQLPTVLSNYARVRRAQGREQAAKVFEDKAKRVAQKLERKRKRRGSKRGRS